MLPGQIIKGSVVTAGVESINVKVAADNGVLADQGNVFESRRKSFDYDIIIIIGIIGVGLGFLVFLAYRAVSVFRDAGIISSNDLSPSQKSLLMLIGVLLILPSGTFLPIPSIGGILYALLLFLLITNYRNIVKAIEYFASKNNDRDGGH